MGGIQTTEAAPQEELTKRLWREGMAIGHDYENIRLNISDDLKAILEERRIFDSDIRQVIHFAETSGTKLVNRKTGHFLAHFKPQAVTYWVEYTTGNDEFVIYDAYLHRMEVM